MIRRRSLVVLAIVLAAGCAGTTAQVYCTMEAKQCPDGSYVGRDPAANCAFKPCPGEREKWGLTPFGAN